MADKKQRTVSVTLFKESGKYYTSESWRAPEHDGYLDPTDMRKSPDFRRIGDGPVLIEADPHSHAPEDENWGFPHIL